MVCLLNELEVEFLECCHAKFSSFNVWLSPFIVDVVSANCRLVSNLQ
jgi:hypothetical protein